jgi:hypothetical protein
MLVVDGIVDVVVGDTVDGRGGDIVSVLVDVVVGDSVDVIVGAELMS